MSDIGRLSAAWLEWLRCRFLGLGSGMRRREFLGLVSGAVVGWLVAARGQPVMPVIGVLNPTSPEANAGRLHAFRQGLKQTGYVVTLLINPTNPYSETETEILTVARDF